MHKTVLAVLSTLLIAVSGIQVATASEHHARRSYDERNFRGSYNQFSEPSFAIPQTRAARNIENFGFSGRDPSRVGGFDPSLHPSGS